MKRTAKWLWQATLIMIIGTTLGYVLFELYARQVVRQNLMYQQMREAKLESVETGTTIVP